jgi:subtilisin family serine protease
MPRPVTRRRRCRAATGLLLLLAALSPAGAAQGDQAFAGLPKVSPAVLGQVRAAGSATFWAILEPQARLAPAFTIGEWPERGKFVMDALRESANSSQAGLRAWLLARDVPFESYWIVNAVRVTGGLEVIRAIAIREEVVRIEPSHTYRMVTPTIEADGARVGQVEWGVDRIRADEVWSTFGVRGRGVTVASIDTGVMFDHPALARQYRGRRPGGLNHNYNWWDPGKACGDPSLAPCDNVGHGTHTMGTMVGDDGAGNQIGVAPRARWIAAKGCEDVFCSDTSLLSSAQWVLAPTDLAGNNPRPALRPQVVNNSWEKLPDDPFFQPMVQAWVASGIVPVFSAGSGGPACGTVGAPASYPESYGVGAFDMGNRISSFSGRGPSPIGGVTKPDVGAPGVEIRSAWNDGDYAILTGTSMATAHVSGTVALIVSAVPSLRGDVDAILGFIDDTAIDTAGTCGGGTDDNNTWGEGRLDAFAAVDEANGP